MLAFAAEERLVSPAEGDDEVAAYVPDPLADTGELHVEFGEPTGPQAKADPRSGPG